MLVKAETFNPHLRLPDVLGPHFQADLMRTRQPTVLDRQVQCLKVLSMLPNRCPHFCVSASSRFANGAIKQVEVE